MRGRELTVTASGLALIACTYGLARYAYGLFLPVFRTEFGLAGGLSGVIASGGFAAYCAAAVLAHRLLARGRAHRTTGLAGALAVVGCLGIAAAQSAGMLAAGVLVAGSGAGLASPAMVALVVEFINARARPRAQAIVNSGTGAGVLLSGPVALLLTGQWRLAWLCFGILTALATTAVWLSTTPARRASAAAPSPAEPGLRHLAGALTAAALIGVGSSAVWTFGADLVVTTGGLSTTSSIVFWTVLGAAGIGGALAGDGVQRWNITRTWVLLVLLLTASTLALAAYPESAAVSYVCAALFGASYIALTGVLIAWGAVLQPTSPARATATLFIVLTLGQAVGAVMVGAVLDATTPLIAFAVAAAIAMVAAIPAAHAPAPVR